MDLADYKKLHKEYLQLRDELKEERKQNHKLKIEVSGLKEKIATMSPTKATGIIKALKEQLEQDKTIKDELHNTIIRLRQERRELATQLTQEKDLHSRKGTGRKRNNATPDIEVIRLRQEGNTIKSINNLTGLSTATINRILKHSKT